MTNQPKPQQDDRKLELARRNEAFIDRRAEAADVSQQPAACAIVATNAYPTTQTCRIACPSSVYKSILNLCALLCVRALAYTCMCACIRAVCFVWMYVWMYVRGAENNYSVAVNMAPVPCKFGSLPHAPKHLF